MTENGVLWSPECLFSLCLLDLVTCNCPIISNALGMQTRSHSSMEQNSIATLHGIEKDFRPLFSIRCKVIIKEMKHGLPLFTHND